MSSFEHRQIAEYLKKIDTPPTDEVEFSKWTKAEKQLEFIIKNANSDDIVIYASPEYSYIYTMAVPENLLEPLNKDDLMGWGANPFSSCASYYWEYKGEIVSVNRNNSDNGSNILAQGTQLIYDRSFEGYRKDERSYFEILQEYIHLAKVHWHKSYNAYCNIDETGDIIPVVSITNRNENNNIDLITFQRKSLEEYLAASNQVLVRMFDFTLFKKGSYSNWVNREMTEFTDSDNLFFEQCICQESAYKRGIQIIRPSRPKGKIFKGIQGYSDEEKNHVEFIIYDWRNNCVTKASTASGATINYFQTENNDLPFEVSPAFFNPEVLSKYKNDKEKYTIGSDGISCRGGWYLQFYGINEANQIFAYIRYLRHLPESELQHWLLYNEEPKATISEKAYKNHFLGEFYDEGMPLENVKKICKKWNKNKVQWWGIKDEELFTNALLPLTAILDEWSGSFVDLVNLVVEGFDKKFISQVIKEKGIAHENQDGSLSLIEKIIRHERYEESFKLSALRDAQRIRNKASHRARQELTRLSEEALSKHGTYKNHFEHICSLICEELKEIEDLFT